MNESYNISFAEWQVMRAIWANAPIAATEIIQELSKTKDWSPATIRTLLGRLVNKKAIGFQEKHRTFYYYPLVTEEECIREENMMLLQKIYGGDLNRETKHFLFYGVNLESYIDQLSETLESNYERVLKHLQYDLQEKIMVYIHSDTKKFHATMGIINAPEWFRASFQGGILHIVSPQYFPDVPAEKVAIHTLCQIIIQKINFNAPMWIYQGVSAYEGGWIDPEWFILLKLQVMQNAIPTFEKMTRGFRKFGENDSDLFFYTLVEFIVTRYGYDKLNQLIREPDNFVMTFGITDNELWNQWVSFLKENYSFDFKTLADFVITRHGHDALRQVIQEPNNFVKIFGITDSELWNQWIAFLKENYG